MIFEFVWKHFGLVEWLLALEIVILLAAAFFYQVAKLIARQDRRDPLVLFYRVFWRSFFSAVPSVKQLDLVMAESMARDAGLLATSALGGSQLSRLDAPDLAQLGDLGVVAPEPRGDESQEDEPKPPADAPKARPIGRSGPEDDDKIRDPQPSRGQPVESRELRYARKQKAKREKAPPARKPRGQDETPPPKRTQTSRFGVRVVPFSAAPRIVGREADEVVIEVTTAPEDGQANGQIIDLLADRIGVRPYQLALVGGHYKVRKTLQVAGLDQASLDQRLAQL